MSYAAFSTCILTPMRACRISMRAQWLQRGIRTAKAGSCSPFRRIACSSTGICNSDLFGKLPQQTHRASLSGNQHCRTHVSWQCKASKVKDMPDKQFQETKEATKAAADDPGANDHFDKILDNLQADATEHMDKAVSIMREALAKMTVAGKAHDEHDSDERKAKKTAEEGKIAVRNVRRRIMQKIGRLARDGNISHDDQDRMADWIQQLTDDRVDEIEELKNAKI